MFQRIQHVHSRRRAFKIGGGLAAVTALFVSGQAVAQRSAGDSGQQLRRDCVVTTPAENKAIVERYFAAWDSADATALYAVLSPDYLHHWGAGERHDERGRHDLPVGWVSRGLSRSSAHHQRDGRRR